MGLTQILLVLGLVASSAFGAGTGVFSFLPQAKIVPSDALVSTTTCDISTAISADGNFAVLGVPCDNNNQGAAYVFSRTGSTWAQQGTKLVGIGASASAKLGTSVAISSLGDTLVVGGPNDDVNGVLTGATWVFTRSGAVWTQQGSKLAQVVPSSFPAQSSTQGTSVALSSDGNTLLVGDPTRVSGANSYKVGAGWVYIRSGGAWTLQQEISDSSYDEQGFSVALSGDGDTAAVGSIVGPGYVFVFKRVASVWTKQSVLLVSSGVESFFGYSLALSNDGNTLAAGAILDVTSPIYGAVYIFSRSSNAWTKSAKVLPSDPTGSFVYFGTSVSLSSAGTTLLVGADGDNNGKGAGWTFKFNGTAWLQTQPKLNSVGPRQQGRYSSLSGDASTILVGSSAVSSTNTTGLVFVLTEHTLVPTASPSASPTSSKPSFSPSTSRPSKTPSSSPSSSKPSTAPSISSSPTLSSPTSSSPTFFQSPAPTSSPISTSTSSSTQLASSAFVVSLMMCAIFLVIVRY